MPSRRKRILVAITLTALAWPAIVPSTSASDPPGESELDRILHNLDLVARAYRDDALGFTCDETIHHYSAGMRRTERLRYLYVPASAGRLTDRRYERKAGPSDPPVDLDELGVGYALLRAYSWVFLFESTRRGRYRYELLGEQDLEGVPAIRVGLEPTGAIQEGVNEWRATIWVDRATYLPLRVEALHTKEDAARASYRQVVLGGTGVGTLHDWTEWTTVFGEEAHGLRYPKEVRIETIRYAAPSRTTKGEVIATTRQLYKNYRFFGVELEAGKDYGYAETDLPAVSSRPERQAPAGPGRPGAVPPPDPSQLHSIDEQRLEALRKAVRSTASYTREWAAEELGESGVAQAMRPLVRALGDEDQEGARRAEIEAITRLAVLLLLHGDPREQRSAVQGLERLDRIAELPDGIAPYLRAYLDRDGPTDLRTRVDRLLGVKSTLDGDRPT